MYRFLVNQKIDNNYFTLEEKIKKHIKVLRLEQKEFLCNYKGVFYLSKIENDKIKIIKPMNEINNEKEHDVYAFISIIKIKNLELVIQKATELGIKKIFLVNTKNTTQKYVQKINENKMKRFQEIILNATEQCFRNHIMEINEEILSFEDAITLNLTKLKIIAHEKENQKLDSFIDDNVSIFVGPEGGYSQEEINHAKENNFKLISLGKSILRAETAFFKLGSLVK